MRVSPNCGIFKERGAVLNRLVIGKLCLVVLEVEQYQNKVNDFTSSSCTFGSRVTTLFLTQRRRLHK